MAHEWENINTDLSFIDQYLVNGSLSHLLNTRLDPKYARNTLGLCITLAYKGKYHMHFQFEVIKKDLHPVVLRVLSENGIRITDRGILIGKRHPKTIDRFKNTEWDNFAWVEDILAHMCVKNGPSKYFYQVGSMGTIFVPIEYVWRIYQLYLSNLLKPNREGDQNE